MEAAAWAVSVTDGGKVVYTIERWGDGQSITPNWGRGTSSVHEISTDVDKVLYASKRGFGPPIEDSYQRPGFSVILRRPAVRQVKRSCCWRPARRSCLSS